MIAPSHIASTLQDRIQAEIRDESERLGKGVASNWEDYVRRVGKISGLRMVDAMIEDIIEDKERR